MKPPRLYSMFCKLTEDLDDSAVLSNVSEVEAKQAFRDKRDYLRQHGFRVKLWIDDCGNLPGMTVRNPKSGKDECQYWLRQTG